MPILARCPPDLPGATFDGRHEQPLDPARVEVVHRLRLAFGRAADDGDRVGHLLGLAYRSHDHDSPRRSIFESTVSFIGGSTISPSPCHSPISGSNSFIAG